PICSFTCTSGTCSRGGSELSLEEILMLYSQPINEEQAWAVCYQCLVDTPKRIEGPRDVRIQKDGAVKLQYEGCDGRYNNYVMMMFCNAYMICLFYLFLQHIGNMTSS
uniref:KIND domain-containing protein n=1 Tax=Hucho hucho TaxID=62062 RepID=A0A4W5PRL8_9TELE